MEKNTKKSAVRQLNGFSHVESFIFHGKRIASAFLGAAKMFRMVIFYNKQLKTPVANGEIGFKDLIFHGQITR